MKIIPIKTKITLAAITLTLSSCATKIPESTLNEYAQNYTALMLCSGHVSQYKMNQTRDLLTYNLHAWSYDSTELDEKINAYYNGYDRTQVTGEICNSYIEAVYSNLVVDYNNRVEQERIISQNMKSTAQVFGQLGNSINSSGSNALATMQSTNVFPAAPVQLENENSILYENMYNPMNSVSGQTLTGSDISASGSKVCIYSAGATKVLPYGSVMCPEVYFE